MERLTRQRGEHPERKAPRWLMLGAFAIVAGSPFLLTMCASGDPKAPAGTPASSASSTSAGSAPSAGGALSVGGASSAVSSAPSSGPSAVGGTSSTVSVVDDVGAHGSAARRPAASDDPEDAWSKSPAPILPYKGRIPTDCATIETTMQALLTGDQRCSSDAECASFAENCACAQPVARASLSHLHALRSAYSAKNCMDKLRARPCATCPPPPPPRCVAGKCT